MIFRPVDIHSDWHFPKSVCKNSDLKWAWAAMQYLVNIHVIHHVTNLSGWSAFHTWTSLLTLEAAASLPCYAFACYISSTTLQLSFCITSCSSVFDQLFVSTDWWVASIVSLNLKRRKKEHKLLSSPQGFSQQAGSAWGKVHSHFQTSQSGTGLQFDWQ